MINFSQDALSTVREFITRQLAVRGINVHVSVQPKEGRNGEQRLEVESTTFQTMPVVAASWKVVDFGSWIIPIEGTTTAKVEIRLHVRYTVQSGGSNGVELFKLGFDTDGERCWGFIMWE